MGPTCFRRRAGRSFWPSPALRSRHGSVAYDQVYAGSGESGGGGMIGRGGGGGGGGGTNPGSVPGGK
jgi:hypothetical protein